MDGLIPNIYKRWELILPNWLKKLEAKLNNMPKIEGGVGEVRPNAEVNRIIVGAEDYAKKMGWQLH